MLAQPVIDTLPGGMERVVSPAPTSWEGTAGWQVELVQEITGAEGTPGELVNPQSVAVDDWGRVYVVDEKPNRIKVYGADGEFIRAIGSEGEGPGEFRVGFLAVHAGLVVLQDPRLARLTVWDSTGAFQRSWTSSCCYWSDIQVDNQGLIYVPSMVPGRVGEVRHEGTPYVRWTLDGMIVDTAWVPTNNSQVKTWTVTNGDGPKQAQMVRPVPLTPRIVSGFNPVGGFLLGWSAEPRIAVSPKGSDTTGIFGRTWTPVPVTAERKRAEVDRAIREVGTDFGEDNLRRTFRLEDIPDIAPAFVAVTADRLGNRWVRLDPGLDSTTTRFDVYNPAGALLGEVVVSPSMPMYGRVAFGRDELVVARENANGMPVVARYRVVRGKK